MHALKYLTTDIIITSKVLDRQTKKEMYRHILFSLIDIRLKGFLSCKSFCGCDHSLRSYSYLNFALTHSVFCFVTLACDIKTGTQDDCVAIKHKIFLHYK